VSCDCEGSFNPPRERAARALEGSGEGILRFTFEQCRVIAGVLTQDVIERIREASVARAGVPIEIIG